MRIWQPLIGIIVVALGLAGLWYYQNIHTSGSGPAGWPAEDPYKDFKPAPLDRRP
jgi:hypothetical protein